ncbi:hypothetical protein OO013_05075 [Mangrovivirga sp. M17]|uniref:DUF4870 domain-containing protein n=1 Tax=Mangrovivirga halotolerans TaxID=2993936 RepID=A0ABT3RN34_9BACT|nr:hypothetical protein [Mangrovivirga halotolerans]MCX2743225.1 hypothetical protein [Mangrovivirga halotolerans]
MEDLNTIKSTNSTEEVDKEGKNIGIISYITLIGLIIAFVMNNDKKSEFASYHIRQSLGLGVTGLALGIIGMIPIIGWIINIIAIFILLYMWVIGILNASKSKMKPVPLLGEKYEEWFKSVG